MDWSDTQEQAAFRDEVRSMIAERLPQRYQSLAQEMHGGERVWQFDRSSDDDDVRGAALEWVDALAERGWVAPHWPQQYGGAGLGAMEQFIFNQEMAEAGAPGVGGSGVSLLGPTLIVHGTDEQKAEHLPKILSGEVAWAQGYSEPAAGSDLASLQTRAVRDGDDYILNGQKIWTSGAHAAESIFALVRTDPDAPKHRGISFIMMTMDTPGISIRPLMDMGWKHYFNETFFEDVRVPAANLVGEENRGWYVGMTLLDFERSNISGAVGARRTLRKLFAFLGSEDGAARSRIGESHLLRGELADRYIETEVMYQFSFRVISMQNAGQLPNYEASTSKLFASEMSQRIALSGTHMFGMHANLWEDGTPVSSFTRSYVGAVPATVRGGTSEVQRNIIATRGLGLPRG